MIYTHAGGIEENHKVVFKQAHCHYQWKVTWSNYLRKRGRHRSGEGGQPRQVQCQHPLVTTLFSFY